MALLKYKTIRYYPNQRNDEFINIGVKIITEDNRILTKTVKDISEDYFLKFCKYKHIELKTFNFLYEGFLVGEDFTKQNAKTRHGEEVNGSSWTNEQFIFSEENMYVMHNETEEMALDTLFNDFISFNKYYNDKLSTKQNEPIKKKAPQDSKYIVLGQIAREDECPFFHDNNDNRVATHTHYLELFEENPFRLISKGENALEIHNKDFFYEQVPSNQYDNLEQYTLIAKDRFGNRPLNESLEEIDLKPYKDLDLEKKSILTSFEKFFSGEDFLTDTPSYINLLPQAEYIYANICDNVIIVRILFNDFHINSQTYNHKLLALSNQLLSNAKTSNNYVQIPIHLRQEVTELTEQIIILLEPFFKQNNIVVENKKIMGGFALDIYFFISRDDSWDIPKYIDKFKNGEKLDTNRFVIKLKEN